ncbi:hypothetical protein BRADI_4g28334v3 [Brachypodium distachyon]|uniref:Uncharacterized protein n=1 Tax=Brachypodium distachyon TaxID=15368 RepID=A0A2K2CQU7_BRADI|nr:hypothetical protein BRADI_4g28334v3 [Brachypodium distachyon]PNT64419.1 hypothetical protein BRADI_4g28334v3 [Brachypodium distachyon]
MRGGGRVCSPRAGGAAQQALTQGDQGRRRSSTLAPRLPAIEPTPSTVPRVAGESSGGADESATSPGDSNESSRRWSCHRLDLLSLPLLARS